MKLCEQFKQHLEKFFSEVYIFDETGDGHFIQIVCVDDQFLNKNLVHKSRLIHKALGEMKEKVHAFSVKGFTAEEWEVSQKNFELVQYNHID
jgi:acid stress-induced BolA-like protein IbaG/YrbA